MIRAFRLCAVQTALLAALIAPAAAVEDEAQRSGELRPSYEPRPPEEKEVYTTDYLFAMTRAVSDSTMIPAAKIPLFVLTVPGDIVFLPIEAIAGFFPSD